MSSIVGWSIPSIIAGVKARRQGGRLGHYRKIIDSLYDDGELDQMDIVRLDRMKTNVLDAYSKGKISELQYGVLEKRISTCYHQVLMKRLTFLSNDKSDHKNNKVSDEDLDIMKNEISSAYAEGRSMKPTTIFSRRRFRIIKITTKHQKMILLRDKTIASHFQFSPGSNALMIRMLIMNEIT